MPTSFVFNVNGVTRLAAIVGWCVTYWTTLLVERSAVYAEYEELELLIAFWTVEAADTVAAMQAEACSATAISRLVRATHSVAHR